MPPKYVIQLIYGCQYRRVLSVSSNVMSIRRTDKHCGARLVAALATLHVAPLLLSPLPRVSSSYPSAGFSPSRALTLDADPPLSPDSGCVPPPTTIPPFPPSPRIFPLYTGPYTAPTPLLSPPPSPPLPAAVAFALELDKGRERACVLSSDSVVTRRAGILYDFTNYPCYRPTSCCFTNFPRLPLPSSIPFGSILAYYRFLNCNNLTSAISNIVNEVINTEHANVVKKGSNFLIYFINSLNDKIFYLCLLTFYYYSSDARCEIIC